MVRAAAEGRSGIAVLVGGSSTGKTRACWEALQLLRDRPEKWRLWHPIDPSRPDAALRELPGIGPRTVVWLNEAQFYLDVVDGGLGERVAAGLRELLRDPARAPVLVMATLWPQFWDGLTARPASGADPHTQARELLAGQDITVPAAFTAPQLQRLEEAGDARLTQAAGAQDGQVIQFLAGAPELLARYRNAPPAAAALIHAAMDARRMGIGIGLPQAFLEAAAPEYLTDTDWDALAEDWLEQALAYTAVPCKGVRGPLTRIHPRPARSHVPGPGSGDSGEQVAGSLASIPDMPQYLLADYLDQYGRYHRKGQFPPEGFWAAAASQAFPDDQATLGDAAHARGLYRAAAQLHKNAAARGNLQAILYLSQPPRYLRSDVRPGRWAAAHVSLRDPGAMTDLLDGLRRAGGAQEQVTALLDRDPAARVSLDNPRDVAHLLEGLWRAGAQEQVTTLAARAAAHVPLDDSGAVASLLSTMGWVVRRQEQVTVLLDRDPAARVSLDNPRDVAHLLDGLGAAGAQEQVTTLAARAAAHVPLDRPQAVSWLLGTLREAGAQDQFTMLATRAAAHFPLGDPGAVADLLDGLRKAGAQDQLTALLDRDPAAHAALDNLGSVSWLLGKLREAGAQDQFTALVTRAAAHLPLDDSRAVADLLSKLRGAGGVQDQVIALAARAATHVPLDNPDGVSWLLGTLKYVGAQQQFTALVDRDPATHVPLDNPRTVAWLLDGLRAANAWDQVTALAARAAARAPLDNLSAVADLLDGLRRSGAQEQVTTLAARAAAHAPLHDSRAVAELLSKLRWVGGQEHFTVLGSRAAAHVPLDNSQAVADLLSTLRKADAQDQITVLLDRDPAAHVPLGNPYDMAEVLLGSLREVGAQAQVTALADRLPAAGMFELFLKQQGRHDRFRFGRQADGSPAGPWGWEYLD